MTQTNKEERIKAFLAELTLLSKKYDLILFLEGNDLCDVCEVWLESNSDFNARLGSPEVEFSHYEYGKYGLIQRFAGDAV